MHPRLSVHSVAFHGTPLATIDGHWRALRAQRVSMSAWELADPALPGLLAAAPYKLEAVTHVFSGGRLPATAEGIEAAQADLSLTIETAAKLGARAVYLLTGGRGALTWEAAAERFSAAIAPCVRHAQQAGVALLIENASNLYVDIHLAHTLRDTIALAEMAGTGICIDHFHCWTEAGFADLVARALPMTGLIQLSDYVPGDRALPARAVPGDGAIPIAPFVEQVLAAGYAHGFDIELLGPRIDKEGSPAALARAGEMLGAMLERLGA